MEETPDIQTFQRWTVPILQKYLRDRDLSLPKSKPELVAMAYAASVMKLPLVQTAEEKLKERAIQYEKLLVVDGVRLPDPLVVDSELADGWIDEDKGTTLWPPTMYFDICNYLFAKVGQQRADLKQRLMTDYKEGKAYSYFTSGWVQKVLYHEITPTSKLCFLKSKVMPSMRVNDEAHTAWIVIEKKTGVVKSAYCTCFAGLGETCNHVAAILFKVDHAWQWGINNKACTSKECLWKGPTSKKAAVKPIPLSAMLIKKPHYAHGGKNRPINHAQRQAFKVVKTARATSLNSIMGSLSLSCPDASVFEYVEMDTTQNYLPSDDVNVKCTVDVATSEPVLLPTTLTEAAKAAKSTSELIEKLVYTDKAVDNLAEQTTGQANNPLWFAHREGRITGSNMHAVFTKVNSIKNNPGKTIDTSALVSRIMGYTKVPEDVPALKYGRVMEDEAKKQYIKVIAPQHKKMNVKPSGLKVCASKGYIGASPDALVSCECCGEGLLEIKCPYSISNQAPAASNLIYLKDGKLSEKHTYYTQVQGQLAVTGRKWCDFFVYTKHGHFHERISLNADYWANLCTNLDLFFVEYLAPEIINRDLQQKSTSCSVPSTSCSVPSTSCSVPSTSCAVPSTSRAVPSTSRAVPSTSRAVPSTSRAVPSTSCAVPSTSRAVPIGDSQVSSSVLAPQNKPVPPPPKVTKKKVRTARKKKPTRKPTYICGSCETVCKETDEISSDSEFSICCDTCKKWFHWSCAGYDGAVCDTWHCSDCSVN